MRLKWTPLSVQHLIDQLSQQPEAIIYCAESALGPTKLVLVELAQTMEAQHFDEIDAWLQTIESKIQAIEAQRRTTLGGM